MTCVVVYAGINWLATRPVDVYIEDYRALGRSDEETLAVALQYARTQGKHWWWINDGSAVIVLDAERDYHFDPEFHDAVDLPVVQRSETGWRYVIQPAAAVRAY